MSATMTKTVSAYHEKLARAVAGLRGQHLSSKQIREAYIDAYPHATDDLKWVQGTDHCIDHTNGGPCECAQSDNAIFVYVARNEYRVR